MHAALGGVVLACLLSAFWLHWHCLDCQTELLKGAVCNGFLWGGEKGRKTPGALAASPLPLEPHPHAAAGKKKRK